MEVRIALDAMGGDFLAIPNLQGAFTAVEKSQSEGRRLKVYLCGPEEALRKALPEAAADPSIRNEFRIDIPRFEKYLSEGLLEIVNCTQVVDMAESPSAAVRGKRDSSLAKAFQLIKEDKAGAMISAGNSGAVMAFGISILGRIPGVKRPAILCHFPSKSGVTVLLDAGANVDCSVDHLYQFAVMGLEYFKTVFEKSDVKVALMNIGEEETKGNEVVKATHQLLKERMPENFFGFVEGRDLMNGKVDVIVCDGFVGNVILKTAEGVASTVKSLLKEELSKNPIWGLGAWLARGGFVAMKNKLDYREYGAAPLIGLNGLGLVAHGSSDGKAIHNALLIAEKYVLQNLMGGMRHAFEQAQASGDVLTLTS
jgi:glycerol-3-phosphate acyltransferase PlsX